MGILAVTALGASHLRQGWAGVRPQLAHPILLANFLLRKPVFGCEDAAQQVLMSVLVNQSQAIQSNANEFRLCAFLDFVSKSKLEGYIVMEGTFRLCAFCLSVVNWSFCQFQGFPRLPRVTQGCQMLPQVTQGCMQFHKIEGISMSLHAVPRAGMQFHDLAYNSMSLHEVT